MKHSSDDDRLVPALSSIETRRCRLRLERGRELRVDGCVLLLIREGRCSLSVNASNVEASEGMLLYLAFDMTVISTADGEIEADCIVLDSTIIGELFFNITSPALWDYLYAHPAFTPETGLKAYLDRMFRQTDWVQAHFASGVSDKVLRSEVESLFTILAAEAEEFTDDSSPNKSRAWAIANDFVTLLHRHYARHHDVAYYASRLNITPDYLNVICRNFLGYTAKSRIDSQIVIAIKTLLDTTDLPVKAIAERLHYDDPSHMCRVFRRIAGMSAAAYRNRHHH